jgi:flavin reductase (DIM6/NTAB) family NADH-FMN oxidoreductase RutF
MQLAEATAAEFVEAMSALASGVVLVTSRVDGRPWGLTATAFASVSADPPTVLVSLGRETVSARTIADADAFGVSILARAQQHVAERAAAPGDAKFLDALVDGDDRESPGPAVPGALAHLDCDVVESIEVADHVVFFGRVARARVTRAGEPLLYHGRGYRSLRPQELRWVPS